MNEIKQILIVIGEFRPCPRKNNMKPVNFELFGTESQTQSPFLLAVYHTYQKVLFCREVVDQKLSIYYEKINIFLVFFSVF